VSDKIIKKYRTKHSGKITKKIRVKRRFNTIALLYHSINQIDQLENSSQEHDLIDSDTLKTVKTIKKILRSRGYHIQEIKITENDLSQIKKIKADYIFNLADSKTMEMKIASILSRMDTPYSGSTFDAIANGNNKLRTKTIFAKYHIPTPKYTMIEPGMKITRSILPSKFPLIVKPAFEHGSIGITAGSVITTFKQLQNTVRRIRRKIKQTLICEQFIKGKEIQIMVLEKKGETIALPPSEMIFRGKNKSKWNIYGFTEKWNEQSDEYKNITFVAPPKGISDIILANIQRDTIRAFYAMNFRDYARFDIRYNTKTKQWYFLEGNPNPGLSSNPEDAATASMLAYDISFDEFILAIVHNTIPPLLHKIRRHS
jgi:D-alanine-D-alanine ligase